MSEKLIGQEFDEAVKARQIAREMARDAAMRGDPICGAYFALRDLPLASFLDDLADYSDDDNDDFRSF